MPPPVSGMPQPWNAVAVEQPLLVRVKRQRESEPLEQLEMEFDPMTNTLKRRKLVTQSEALAKQFNDQLNLEHAQTAKGGANGRMQKTQDQKSEVTFTLGQRIEDK